MPSAGSNSRSLALDNLRAVVILIVLAFHSALAYISWTPPIASNFNSPPYGWTAFPIVDNKRFFGFDLLCAWQDVYLMSLMFFLSGLFVTSSLLRKGVAGFLRDRMVRLGVPYVFGILVLTPLVLYPAYQVREADPSVAAYLQHLLALPFWPNLQLWFLWQLVAMSIIVAGLQWLAPDLIQWLGRWSAAAGARPVRYLMVLLSASAVVYVPLALAFTPWAWSHSGIFTFQFCRPLHYLVYFLAGVGIGAAGLDRGFMAPDGPLARYWAWWLAAALGSLFVWIGLTALTFDATAPLIVKAAADVAFVHACAAGCFFLVGVCLRFATWHSRILAALAANAYSLYLLHYGFGVWLQYALFGTEFPAVVKAAIVFGGTVLLSWILIVALQQIPFGARLIGAARPPVAGFAP